FSELFFNAAGKRVFNVTIEGQTVLQNFDIWALVGKNAALQRTFTTVVTDGMLNIVGTGTVNNAKLSAIQIVPSGAPTPTPTPTPTPSATPVRINCGGPLYIDSLGQTWLADKYFVGGTKQTYSATISGTSDQTLYQSERFAQTLTYQIPVTNGNYEVTIDFSENFYNAAGKRVFNVAIEGQTVLQNLDIWALTGRNSALQRTFAVNVTDGTLNIVGTASVDNAKFSAIEV